MSSLTQNQTKMVTNNKTLDGGIHENLELLRKALNEICENNSLAKPTELLILNDIFKK